MPGKEARDGRMLPFSGMENQEPVGSRPRRSRRYQKPCIRVGRRLLSASLKTLQWASPLRAQTALPNRKTELEKKNRENHESDLHSSDSCSGSYSSNIRRRNSNSRPNHGPPVVTESAPGEISSPGVASTDLVVSIHPDSRLSCWLSSRFSETEIGQPKISDLR